MLLAASKSCEDPLLSRDFLNYQSENSPGEGGTAKWGTVPQDKDIFAILKNNQNYLNQIKFIKFWYFLSQFHDYKSFWKF